MQLFIDQSYNINSVNNHIIVMVKVYYSYKFQQPVGFVSSRICNFAIDHKRKNIVTASSQYIIILSLKSGQVVKHLYKDDKNVAIRYIRLSAHKVYAGYEDGQIAVWDLDTYEFISSLDLHKSTVSSISLSDDETKMISGGLDGNIIIWDLLSEENHQIKSAHNNAVTQVELTSVLYRGKPTSIIISIGKDGFLKVWDAESNLCLSVISTQTTEALTFSYNLQRNLIYVGTNKEDIVLIKINENVDSGLSLCEAVGTFKRKNYTRCQQLVIQYNKMYILSEKKMEVYELLSEDKLKQKRKRAASRKRAKTTNQQDLNDVHVNDYELHIVPLQEKSLLFKVYNFDMLQSRIFLNNGSDIIDLQDSHQLTHSSDRTQQLQMAYPFLIQRNSNNLHVYDYGTFNHLFSISTKAICCSLFNNGYLMLVSNQSVTIWDLAKNQSILILQEQWAGCWVKQSKCLLWRENQIGFFDVGADSKGKAKMRLISTKHFEDKVTSAMYRHSFDKYAVNLQNSQIHLQYSDTHKNCLKLYGHKMPINSFDISSDDALLVTGSIDKDIRFWDLDFGHSIKTIFAHSQAVTAVRFVPDTHYVISGSKDGHVKFWDGDTHQLILDLEENILEIKSLAITAAGDYIIGGGLDGGFRVWKQTNDQTIAGDQDEKNLQKVMIEEYTTEKFKNQQVKTRYQDLKHGEQIIEALQQNQQPPTLIKMLKKISPSNLKSSLSFLHATHVQKLQQYIKFMVRQNYETEVCWRVIEALNNGSDLGRQLRTNWEGLNKQLRMNKQCLKMLLKSLREEKDFIL